MDLNQLTNVLTGTLVPATQKSSEQQLKMFEQANLAEYLRALATIISDPQRPPMAIRVAGVDLKNHFYDSRSDAGLKRKYQAWNTTVPDQIKQFIRNSVLRALCSPVEDARTSAAQIVGALGVLEISEGRWPELILTLHENSTNPQLPDEIKISTLDAMGYLCESLSPQLVNDKMTDNLLTAIVSNMMVGKHPLVRRAAAKALFNTLDFAAANMGRQHERDYIVSNICECARADKADIRWVAFDCMSQLAELYYHLLSVPYMDAFFSLTVEAVKAAGTIPMNSPNYSEVEKVALHATNFWATLCEREIDLAGEMQHAQNSGYNLEPERTTRRFIQKAMNPLVDLITTYCLTRQAEELTDDEDNWTLAMAGSTLLGLIARCEPENIIRVIMPFVQKNLPLLGPNTWRQREAGLMAFGMCLEGPDSQELAPFIREGLEFFLNLLDPAKESIPQVRDSATWVIGQVCELHSELISEYLPRIVAALLAVLKDPIPIVAAKSAQAIQYLAASFRDDAAEPTNKLSPFLPATLPRLLETTERSDWEEGELRGLCFEAINSVVESSASDGFPILVSLLDAIIGRLSAALNAQVSSQSQRDEVQGMIQYCCGTILVITYRLKSGISPQAETIMFLMVRILDSLHNGNVVMDAHLVVGAVANALGVSFLRFYPKVIPFVIKGIENSEDYQTCQTATELVSDLSRAINKNIGQASPSLVAVMLANLANEEVHRSVKPTTLSALGDLALALGPQYEVFAASVLKSLDAAVQLVVPRDDPDMVDYLNEVREAAIEAYTAVINALRGPVAVRYFYDERIDLMLNFLVTVCSEAAVPDSDVAESVIKGAVGLVGDLCSLGPNVRVKARTALLVFKPAIEICNSSDDDDTRQVAQFCLKQLGA